MRASNILEKKVPLNTYWRVQLVYVKVQAHSSLEPPLVYNQDQAPFKNQSWLLPSLRTWE